MDNLTRMDMDNIIWKSTVKTLKFSNDLYLILLEWKKISLNEDIVLDEIEGKKKVNVIKEHCMEKVSNGTEP